MSERTTRYAWLAFEAAVFATLAVGITAVLYWLLRVDDPAWWTAAWGTSAATWIACVEGRRGP
jgi:hypothetical protein